MAEPTYHQPQGQADIGQQKGGHLPQGKRKEFEFLGVQGRILPGEVSQDHEHDQQQDHFELIHIRLSLLYSFR